VWWRNLHDKRLLLGVVKADRELVEELDSVVIFGFFLLTITEVLGSNLRDARDID
jgi:hypothetical protein